MWGAWARLPSNREWLAQYARSAALTLSGIGELPEEFREHLIPSQNVRAEVFPPPPVWIRRGFGHLSRDQVELYRVALLSRPVLRYGDRPIPTWARGKVFP